MCCLISSISDVLDFVGITQSRSASFKKSQWTLKSALQKIIAEGIKK